MRVRGLEGKEGLLVNLLRENVDNPHFWIKF